jgi:hypothetical protein
LRMKLVKANHAAKVTGLDELAGTSNYFIGNDSKKWRSNVPTYAKGGGGSGIAVDSSGNVFVYPSGDHPMKRPQLALDEIFATQIRVLATTPSGWLCLQQRKLWNQCRGGKSLRQPDSAESLCESRSAETKSAAATLCRRLRKGVEGACFDWFVRSV